LTDRLVRALLQEDVDEFCTEAEIGDEDERLGRGIGTHEAVGQHSSLETRTCHGMPRLVTLALLSMYLLAAASAGADPTASPDDALLALCRVWNAVRFTSPDLQTETDANWDNALLAVVVDVERDPATLRPATNRMLTTLHDPLTSVSTDAPNADGPTGMPHYDDRGGIRHVRLSGYPAPAATTAYESALRSALQLAPGNRALLVDLRTTAAPSARQLDSVLKAWNDVSLAAYVTAETTTIPQPARRYMLGFPSETGQGSSAYVEGFESVTPERTVAPNSTASSAPIAFIVDANSAVPDDAVALVRANRAAVFSSDGSSGILNGELLDFDAGAGLTVDLRTAGPPGGLPTRRGDLRDAIVWLLGPSASPLPPVTPQRALTERYASAELPDESHRLLAAFRIWGAIAYAFPYRSLMHDDWDAALRQATVDLRSVRTSEEYDLVLMRFYAHLHDSHGFVSAPAVSEQYSATPPFAARDIEGHPTIVRVDPMAAKRDGFSVGDVILSVDDEPVAARARRLSTYTAASTPQAMREILDDRTGVPTLFAGPGGSSATLRMRKADGTVHTLRVIRETHDAALRRRTRDVVQVLPGNVGYFDLARLNAADTNAAMRRVAATRALVLDLRGYPHGTAWTICPHLIATRTKVASFRTPVVRYPLGAGGRVNADVRYGEETRDFDQFIDPAPPRYGRPIVVIIDSRAGSQSEHSGLFYKAAANALFVGEPTMGVDGDITQMMVPGDVTLGFTGQAVAHPNGRQLQRIGLIPDVPVSQTLRSLRLGIDDQLSAALAQALRLAGALNGTRREAIAAERALEVADARAQGTPQPVALAPKSAPALDTAGFAVTPTMQGYRGTPDPSVRHDDGRAVMLRAESGATDLSGAIYRTNVETVRYQGKRLRVSGYIRCERAQRAQFLVRVDAPTGRIYGRGPEHALVGNQDWTPFAIVVDVPTDATAVSAGLYLSGPTGAVWADDLRIDTVDETVRTTN
jgi:C-terminal processing protease CtpA/Prc